MLTEFGDGLNVSVAERRRLQGLGFSNQWKWKSHLLGTVKEDQGWVETQVSHFDMQSVEYVVGNMSSVLREDVGVGAYRQYFQARLPMESPGLWV